MNREKSISLSMVFFGFIVFLIPVVILILINIGRIALPSGNGFGLLLAAISGVGMIIEFSGVSRYPNEVKHKMTSDEIDFMHEYDFNNCTCEECKRRRQKEAIESEVDPIKFHVRESEGDYEIKQP